MAAQHSLSRFEICPQSGLPAILSQALPVSDKGGSASRSGRLGVLDAFIQQNDGVFNARVAARFCLDRGPNVIPSQNEGVRLIVKNCLRISALGRHHLAASAIASRPNVKTPQPIHKAAGVQVGAKCY
jgi:hypothetical protein